MNPSTEKSAFSSRGPQDLYRNLEEEAETRLETYGTRVLQQLGDWLGAHRLILYIRDNDQERRVLLAKLTRNHNAWHLETEGPEIHPERPSAKRRSKPIFTLKSQFNYSLNLPHRWMGMLTLEYLGISCLSHQEHAAIDEILKSFSQHVTLVLMERNLADLQNRLNQEKKVTEDLRSLVSNLSKELYCLSSISNAIGQSYNVEGVLTGVLETILPLLRASLGVIYFPETRQCVTFQSPRSKPKRREDPWFKYYFETEMSSPARSSGRNSFSIQSVADHPRFPVGLRSHLVSQGIESVLEFSLCHQNELLGMGFLGLQQNREQPADTRLLMITLNMIGLFLEHISLMGDLERQVKLISKEKLDMEKKQRFLIDNMGRPFAQNNAKRSPTTDRLLDEIERSRNMALLAELASGIAHQIRNPLSNLVYGLHLLQQDEITEHEKKELFQTVTERVELMNRMISDFIRYTRIPELRLTVESINDILKNTLRLFSGWTALADVELSTSFDPDLPCTKVDLFLLNQAFQNVIKNAMEAMRDHGTLWVSTRKLKIRHGPEPHLEFAEIVFEDDGPGIAEEDIDKALKPFYSKKEGGLGLGLPLVEHIVRVHGGAVTLENGSNGGVRVMIYLPIR
ncbi:MAG TPA: ATP-binding protein [Desulfomonilaceae bacterium]|nr:ATP-binding protein [Desulfomonilaceae bacterium]